jgi:hypothetical protein
MTDKTEKSEKAVTWQEFVDMTIKKHGVFCQGERRMQKQGQAKNWYDDLEDLVISFKPKPTQWGPWLIITIVYPTYENKNTGTVRYKWIREYEYKFETPKEFSRALDEIVDLFPADFRVNVGLSKELAPRTLSEQELKTLEETNLKRKEAGACLVIAKRADRNFPQFSENSVDGKNWTIAYEPSIGFTSHDVYRIQNGLVKRS